MPYVDGYVIPIRKKNLKAYRRMATVAGKVWKKHGALQFMECAGDDLKIDKKMKITAFPRAARARSGETVLFSWVVYRSRAHRNSVNAKVMKDPRIIAMMDQKPIFDMKRMVFGGFKVIVEG